MKARPLISVCIANYNGMAVIGECLESVRAQPDDLLVEIIVHDDASIDDSVTYIRERYPEVRLIESKENVGFCIANNRMAEAALGKYLLLLNNDATLFPDALPTLQKAAEEIEQPAVLGLPQYDYDSGRLLDIGSLLDPFLNPVPNQDPKRDKVGMVMGSCLWLPKILWDELGSFPEWFGSIGEDLYLCCRARLAGYPVRALGSSGYRHRVGRSFGGGKPHNGKLTTTVRRRALTERNKTFVMAMTFPPPFMQFMLPLHLLLLLIEGALLSLVRLNIDYLTKIYLPVFSALWRRSGKLHSTRKEIMRYRRIGGTEFFTAFDPIPHKFRMLLRHGLPRLT